MKSTPERVYGLLIEANLAPEEDPAPVLTDQARSLTVVDDLSVPEKQQRVTRRRLNARPALVALAVATIAALGALAALLVSDAIRNDVVQPPTLEQEAIGKAESWFAAVEEGRIDDLQEVLGELSVEDRLMWGFNAVLADSYPRELRSCEVTNTVGSIVTVECLIADSDPVFAATGTSELIYPFRYQDGVLTWHTFRVAEGLRSPFAGPAAYVDYFEVFLPDEFAAACSPASYTGDFVYNGYMVLAPPCANFIVRHAEDVAAWLEAGRPAP